MKKIAQALDMGVNELFQNEQEGFWKKQKWMWESMMLMFQQEDKERHKALRILRELFHDEDESPNIKQ